MLEFGELFAALLGGRDLQRFLLVLVEVGRVAGPFASRHEWRLRLRSRTQRADCESIKAADTLDFE